MQFLVPNGGRVGGCRGAIDGGVKGQMAGGHIGGKSSDDSQIGFISPLTHLQTQAALASRFKMRKKNSARICFKFILFSSRKNYSNARIGSGHQLYSSLEIKQEK